MPSWKKAKKECAEGPNARLMQILGGRAVLYSCCYWDLNPSVDIPAVSSPLGFYNSSRRLASIRSGM